MPLPAAIPSADGDACGAGCPCMRMRFLPAEMLPPPSPPPMVGEEDDWEGPQLKEVAEAAFRTAVEEELRFLESMPQVAPLGDGTLLTSTAGLAFRRRVLWYT
mmetsp:Transcript_36287/g.77386  ORF Transcript_36287/g.77386 Transcript_36287/m.77386 type:complete len:103 (-) Transcript_36287:148-456(-)